MTHKTINRNLFNYTSERSSAILINTEQWVFNKNFVLNSSSVKSFQSGSLTPFYISIAVLRSNISPIALNNI